MSKVVNKSIYPRKDKKALFASFFSKKNRKRSIIEFVGFAVIGVSLISVGVDLDLTSVENNSRANQQTQDGNNYNIPNNSGQVNINPGSEDDKTKDEYSVEASCSPMPTFALTSLK